MKKLAVAGLAVLLLKKLNQEVRYVNKYIKMSELRR